MKQCQFFLPGLDAPSCKYHSEKDVTGLDCTKCSAYDPVTTFWRHARWVEHVDKWSPGPLASRERDAFFTLERKLLITGFTTDVERDEYARLRDRVT